MQGAWSTPCSKSTSAGEASKGGFAPGEVAAALEALARLDHIRLHGLMAIPPRWSGPRTHEDGFVELRGLAERHGLKELSMGMSADFEVAIEEGATMVRVGTAIFGADGRPGAGSARVSVKGKTIGFVGVGRHGRGAHQGHRGGGPGRS